MLQTRSLTFAYPSAMRFAFPDLSCGPGEALLILGRSGVGKTTLLHLLGGLLRPLAGEIRIGETNISALNTKALDRFRGQHIGLILQQAHFVAALSVHDNLRLAQFLASMPQDEGRIEALLERLGLGEKRLAMPQRLSMGQQQRVGIARALLHQPRLILADEPTSALDDESTFEVLQLLREAATLAQAALVIVTHDKRLKDHLPHQIELTPASVSGT